MLSSHRSFCHNGALAQGTTGHLGDEQHFECPHLDGLQCSFAKRFDDVHSTCANTDFGLAQGPQGYLRSHIGHLH